MMLTITEEAALQIRRAAEGEGEDATLRVAARRVEDGSIDYGLGFDRTRPGDTRVPFQGVVVVVAPGSRELLEGTTIDYVEMAPGDYRFIFAARATEMAP
jgi:iron-sulfur cluster assembly protein